MKRSLAAAVVALIAVAGCGDSASSPDLDRLAAEVQAAAAALLKAPGFEGTAIRLGENRAVSRVDWTDFRPSNEYRLVSIGVADPGGTASVFGLVQVAGNLFSAQRGTDQDSPWATLDEELTTRVPLSLDLEGIAAEGPVLTDLGDDVELAREDAGGGAVRWVLVTAHRDDDRLIRTWVIDGDGVLRAHSMRTESGGFIVGAESAYEFSFDPREDPAPITAPAIGSPLDLAELGAPADLPLVP